MKKVILFLVIIMTGMLRLPLYSQIDKEPVALGLPGDNLNLYAVLEVFQKSPTLEGFEKAINDKESKINNLDLNNDNVIDYIQVVSYKEADSHSIVLRVAINSKEFQDVAVIEVDKNKSGKIIVQIIGDEELYGKDYIVEPAVVNITETPNPGFATEKTVIINNTYSITNLGGNGFLYVNDWPIIIHLFAPSFSVYISPWHWGYYPSYWYPWAPVYYYNYWGYHHHYYNNHFYRRTTYVRNPIHHSYYTTRRISSPTVMQNRSAGRYTATYQGKSYRKPEIPSVRPSVPSIRPVPPARRPNVPMAKPIIPSTRPAIPETKPVAPTTKPRFDKPSIRPVEPIKRPSVPTMKPRTPSIKPIAPSNRPTREREVSPSSRRDQSK